MQGIIKKYTRMTNDNCITARPFAMQLIYLFNGNKDFGQSKENPDKKNSNKQNADKQNTDMWIFTPAIQVNKKGSAAMPFQGHET
jgi:hypothetical protein